MFKPNQILRYDTEMSTRKRLVEAISYPTPNDTIMVRMVPGDPTTMVEMPLVKLSKALGTKVDYKYTRFAKVHGVGSFPEDMLRYDNAYLYDYTQHEEPCDEDGRHLYRPTEPVLIWTVTRSLSVGAFTVLRWQSFGWSVRELEQAAIRL